MQMQTPELSHRIAITIYACDITGIGICSSYTQLGAIMSQTAKLFMNGRSQAVRIPKAYSFAGVKELNVSREGNKLILEPVRKSWLTLNEDSEPIGDGFMEDRPDLFKLDPDRTGFE